MTQFLQPESPQRLLFAGDPVPFEVVNPDARGRLVLICEHAGCAVPAALGDLGIAPAEFGRHIAYDLGAAPVARLISDQVGAPLVLQPYSRLVIDCNRPLEASDCIPEVSDGTEIPANAGLDQKARRQRLDEIHTPFHEAVSALIDEKEDPASAVLVAIHSFTPQLRTRPDARPWEIGLLFNRDDRLARRLMSALKAIRPELIADFNQPYSVSDTKDYAMPVHGERRGLPHVLIEVRSDLIETETGQSQWANLLSRALSQAIS